MEEIWKPIQGYEGRYEISTLGRIRSYAQSKTGKIRTGNINKHGYLTTVLYNKEKEKSEYLVHRLVAYAFINNPGNLPQVNHKDENKQNNCVDNLEWCTNDYNIHYGTALQRAAESNKCCQTTSKAVYCIREDEITQEFDSIGEAERQTGISHCNIVAVLQGRRHFAGGYKWYYKS